MRRQARLDRAISVDTGAAQEPVTIGPGPCWVEQAKGTITLVAAAAEGQPAVSAKISAVALAGYLARHDLVYISW